MYFARKAPRNLLSNRRVVASCITTRNHSASPWTPIIRNLLSPRPHAANNTGLVRGLQGGLHAVPSNVHTRPRGRQTAGDRRSGRKRLGKNDDQGCDRGAVAAGAVSPDLMRAHVVPLVSLSVWDVDAHVPPPVSPWHYPSLNLASSPHLPSSHKSPLLQENVCVLPHDNYYRHRPDLSDEVPFLPRANTTDETLCAGL